MSTIRITEVQNCYGKNHFLQSVSLECKAGELTCLLGPSGCGKSTLLRCIAGHERVCAGQIALGDTLLCSKDTHLAPERRHIGLVFQDYSLFPHLNVWQNVAFGLHKQDRATRKRTALDMLERFGLSDLANRYPHTCSGGQQQRIATARALAPRPDALLLDEPFSSLDSGLREQLRVDLIRILREENIPTVLVTHDPREALSCADKIALLREGTLVQTGTPDDLWARPLDAEVAAFFSPVTCFDVEVRDGSLCAPFGEWSTDQEDGKYTLVLREAAWLLDEEGPIHLEVKSQASEGLLRRFALACDDGRLISARTRDLGPLPERVRLRLAPNLIHLFPR